MTYHQLSSNSSLPDRSLLMSSSQHSPSSTFSSSPLPLLRFPTHSDDRRRTERMGEMTTPYGYRQTTSSTLTRPHHPSTHRPSLHSTHERRNDSSQFIPCARDNHLSSHHLLPFSWSQANYDPPIYVHRRMSEQFLQLMTHKIAQVRLFNITTESAQPRRAHSSSSSSPTSIFIQCISHAHCSTIFVIDTRQLPATFSPLFSSIQNLCRFIFSPLNVIVSWGDVVAQLRPFAQHNLFDLSHLTNTLNLQKIFTDHWNSTHPHTSECLSGHTDASASPIADDFLVCLVDANDLDDEFHPLDTTSDFNTCMCPDYIRPYKAKNSVWSLSDALRFTFGLTEPTSNDHSVLSCALDNTLHTGFTHSDTALCQTRVDRTLSHLFASSRLFFHLSNNFPSFHLMATSIDLHTISSVNPSNVPVVLLISDSHGKHFPPTFTSPNYCLITRPISGLQWIHRTDSHLCARSILQSPVLSSLLASAVAVIFLIGTNSVRSMAAPDLISPIQEIINLLRSHYLHLKSSHSISVVLPFPCCKPSARFPTTASLTSNIASYIGLLNDLAAEARISLIDPRVSTDQLHHDGMHLQPQHQSSLFSTLCQHVTHIIARHTLSRCTARKRSQTALSRRNEQKNARLLEKRKQHTLIRPIHRSWLLKDTKQYLKHKQIPHARLPEIYRQKIRIQFNNSFDLHRANEALPMEAFNEESYIAWISGTHNSQSV